MKQKVPSIVDEVVAEYRRAVEKFPPYHSENQSENGIIYLACPYAHPDPVVRDWRYNTACRTAAQLIKQGYAVFSPLSHSLPIAKSGDLPDTDTGFWLKQDLLFLRLCGKVFVLTLPGWEESTGVRAEIAEAKKRNIPVMFIDREEITCATS